jgi:hypothetical protein
VCAREALLARLDEALLLASEAPVKRPKELGESRRQIAFDRKARRSYVQRFPAILLLTAPFS